MSLESLSYHQVIELAATFEQRGYELYTKASKLAEQEPAKNMLLFLAEQEKKHEQAFRKMYENIKNIDSGELVSISEESLDYLDALSKSSIFPADDNKFLEQIKSLDDVLEVATQTEKDSILFYVELSFYAPDEETEKFFKFIIGEEKNHLVKIQQLDKLIKERGVVY